MLTVKQMNLPRKVGSWLVLCTSLVMFGCIDMQMRAGNEIDMTALEALELGVSTERDVLALLGEPFGKGRSFLPFQAEPVDAWSYYYELATMSDDRRTFLFVYVDEGIYDGYMWFSSLPEELQ